jgi:hypothetical protein
MTIAFTVTRPKLDLTTSVGVEVAVGTSNLDGNSVFLPIQIKELTANASPVFSCTFDDENPTITLTNTTGNPISNSIRIGDTVSGDMDAFPLGVEYVTNIVEVGTEITLTLNVIPAQAGTNIDLTFVPEAIDSKLYILELTHTLNGSNLLVNPKLHIFDGNQILDADADGVDDSDVSNATSVRNYGNQLINLDVFLKNARISRTN